ncbi:hypothetical protein BWI15_17645 [Kribbella sp. ALI-6-A]|nr:hypothetical protein BWI15_17645 [Kribbella sp. ALI-6-A]
MPPPGSAERAERQQLGEALLTDDGRVTETPQAKTLAIGALAARMRASTPELVLASMGLAVGNDMAGRLGDRDYVLLPHNERYPSMGADVLHADELRSAQYQEAAHRAVRMDTDQAETLVRMIAVSELMGAWSYGSNNNVRVLALQETARDEFGLRGVLDWQLDPRTRSAVDLELDYNRDALGDFLRTQYAMTQEVLAARGVAEVISYRALSWPEGSDRPSWAVEDTVGSTIEVPQRPLASWSADRRVVADWLEERRGHGVILAARHSAQDVFSLPTTGMGFLGQKEWVTLPGDHRATVDGVVSHLGAGQREQSAAAAVMLGRPAIPGVVAEPARMPGAAEHVRTPAAAESASAAVEATPAAAEATPAAAEATPAAMGPAPGATDEGRTPGASAPAADERFQPAVLVPNGPAHELDRRIGRILDGAEEPPAWWLRDDSGYSIARRDLEFLQIDPQQVRWMLTGESPMGLTPELYQQFGAQMLEALERDGVDASQVDLRLKGTGAGFFSGLHKTLPREAELADRPQAVQRLREWFGNDQNRPLRRPYDSMYRLGLDSEPSDFDLDINSTAAVRAAREHWRAHHNDRYPGDFMGGHGYLDKDTVHGALPALSGWAKRWEDKLGRPMSLGVFESTGPFNAQVLGRELSSHFKDSDWIIHRPQDPMAWRTPRSRVIERPAGAGAGVAPAPVAGQAAGQASGQAAAPAAGQAGPGLSITAGQPAPGTRGPGQGRGTAAAQPEHLRRGGTPGRGSGRGR